MSKQAIPLALQALCDTDHKFRRGGKVLVVEARPHFDVESQKDLFYFRARPHFDFEPPEGFGF